MPRPKLEPTSEDRRLVRSFAACGIRQEEIARIMGIRSPKTLRKHFREELDRGAPEANYNVAQSLYKKATSGDTEAAKFWLKCRAGWKDRPAFEIPPIPPPAFIVAQEPHKDAS